LTLRSNRRQIEWQKDEIKSYIVVTIHGDFVTEVIGTHEFIESLLQEMRDRYGDLRVEEIAAKTT
jgi:hypothetical protein